MTYESDGEGEMLAMDGEIMLAMDGEAAADIEEAIQKFASTAVRPLSFSYGFKLGGRRK